MSVADAPGRFTRRLEVGRARRQGDMTMADNAMIVSTIDSAFGEGRLHAVGEAMACGVSCVVTDCGDAAAVVGPTGLIVPVDDAAAMAEAWRALLAGDRAVVAGAARDRVEREFSAERLVERTEALLLPLTGAAA